MNAMAERLCLESMIASLPKHSRRPRPAAGWATTGAMRMPSRFPVKTVSHKSSCRVERGLVTAAHPGLVLGCSFAALAHKAARVSLHKLICAGPGHEGFQPGSPNAVKGSRDQAGNDATTEFCSTDTVSAGSPEGRSAVYYHVQRRLDSS